MKTLLLLLMCSFVAFGQTKWKRQVVEEKSLELFHSTYAVVLPTTETLKQGDFLYTIAHRFNSPISSGFENLWGLDGSATIRFSLGYAITDKLLLNLGRSNREGNWDLEAKYKYLEIDNEKLPISSSILVGMAYNQNANAVPVTGAKVESDRLLQFYFALPINTLILDKSLGIGLVPSYLYNSYIQLPEPDYSFVLGAYVQYYFNDMVSIVAEAAPTVIGWRNRYDSFSFALEMETGGHFFKLIASNNVNLNMAQFLAGSRSQLNTNTLHFGFQITRNL